MNKKPSPRSLRRTGKAFRNIGEQFRQPSKWEAKVIDQRARREAEAKLGLRLVDVGYKALARNLHPDRGGSEKEMALLNRARDHLKAYV